MLFFDSEHRPYVSSQNLKAGDNHNEEVSFEGNASEDIRRDIKHPDEPEQQVHYNDGIVQFFAPKHELFP